jgi:hypothetical protein
MKNKITSILVTLALLLLPATAYAWDETGHKVVARIAWSKMTEQTRRNVISLLRSAPNDAGLRNLFRTSDPRPVRDQFFFMRAATWPDLVRDERFPVRRRKYHRTPWHFINFFWEQNDAGVASDLARDPEPKPENIVERLQLFETTVADGSKPARDRAVELAWIMHLAGDIHQPLHCSARVTSVPGEENGDRGGNLFSLSGSNLHSFWDNILDSTFRRLPGETPDAYASRIAVVLMAQNAMPEATALKLGQFQEWAKAGHETSKRVAYPQSLVRNQRPSEEYRRAVQRAAEPALALAGYRLAHTLNRLFGS